MTQDRDHNTEPTTEPTGESLHDQALRHYGQRFFAEVKNQSAREAAELQSWKKEQRGQRGWLARLGSLGAGGGPDTSSGGSDGK